jgi:hypothetical protein
MLFDSEKNSNVCGPCDTFCLDTTCERPLTCLDRGLCDRQYYCLKHKKKPSSLMITSTKLVIGMSLLAAAGIAIATKPSQELLYQKARADLSRAVGGGIVGGAIGALLQSLATATEITDCILFRVAQIDTPDGQRLFYVGALNAWFAVQDVHLSL